MIWGLTIDNQTVLSRVPHIMVIRGTQGVFVAHDIGEVKLSAVGDIPDVSSHLPHVGYLRFYLK